jgi:hypothetical protein
MPGISLRVVAAVAAQFGVGVSTGDHDLPGWRATLKLRQSTLLTDLSQAAIAFFNSKSKLTSSLCGEDR